MQPMNVLKFFSIGTIKSLDVLKNLPDAVIIAELDGHITWVNQKATKMFRGFENDLLNIHLDEIITEGLALIEESSAKQKSIVTGAIAINGEEFFVELNCKKFIEQYFITIRDVTQMTNVFSDVEMTGKLSREKNLMLHKLSNDFLSPIQSILGFSQAMKDGLCGDVNDKQQKYLEIINKNAKELSIFMEKFFEFSFVESTLYKPDLKVFDSVFAIKSVLKEFELETVTKKLTLNFDYDELAKKAVYTDEYSFKLIVKNIIETSINLTDMGGIDIKISNPTDEEIRTCHCAKYSDLNTASYIKLEIKDTGIGLSESETKTLFEPYSLLDSSNKKAFLRSIILDSAKIVTERLKGDLNVRSEVMKGAVYTVILPIDKDREFENE